jgi:hypothetical protein
MLNAINKHFFDEPQDGQFLHGSAKRWRIREAQATPLLRRRASPAPPNENSEDFRPGPNDLRSRQTIAESDFG